MSHRQLCTEGAGSLVPLGFSTPHGYGCCCDKEVRVMGVTSGSLGWGISPTPVGRDHKHWLNGFPGPTSPVGPMYRCVEFSSILVG